MELRTRHVLITGSPGVGKTTLVKGLCQDLKALNPVGFFTEEIRERGIRQGFSLVAVDGRRKTLAHTRMHSPFLVSRYGVDVDGFESFLESIDLLTPNTNLVVIDEIGKMECFSVKFRNLINMIWDSPKTLIATVALRGGGFIEEIKGRQDADIIELTVQNRNSLRLEILAALRL